MPVRKELFFMRLVNVENIQPNMELAKPINHQGQTLLNTGINNLHKYKKRLLDIGVNYVYINDKYSQDIELKDVVKKETRNKSKKIIKETFQGIEFNQDINITKVKDVVNDIIDDILFNSEDLMVNMVDIKSFDSYTFEHSVNVAVLSIILGKSINLPRKKLYKLGIGAILHDIGKMLIPKKVLKKTDKLTEEEYEIIKEHPRLGYDYLKNKNEISPVSKIIILSHHERLDGTGYPKRIPKKEIHQFGKIVAITDVFDALTSDRIYRDRWPIHKAINYLMSNTDNKFDSNLVKKFIRNIAVYPNGTKVKLKNGEKAIVKEQNKNFPTRPVIKIIENNNEKKETSQTQTLDLMEHFNKVIDKVIQ